jgi:hypothetical protein
VLSLLGIQTTVARGVQSVKERIRLDPVRFAATTVVVLLGLFLRARGFLFDRHGLWLDEALWAIMLMHDPLITLLIRPIGFMSVTKALAVVFGPGETVLRLLAWLAGMGSVLLAPALARRLFRAPAARLLFVALIALHPAAIDLTKEFKPYSVSLFAHLLLVLLTLRYLDTQRASHLVAALVAAPVTSLFAQDMVMAFPGIFLLLGWNTLRRERQRVPWVIGTAVLILLVLFAQYWFIWRNIEPGEASTFWGHKYDVFYIKNKRHSHLAWWFEHYLRIAASPGLRSRYWNAAFATPEQLRSWAQIDNVVWQIIQAVGIVVVLAFRRYREAILLLVPFVATTLLNTTGHWPFGLFRTNLFLLGYAMAVAAMAFDWAGARAKGWVALVPTTVLVLLPLCALDRSWNARKRALTYDTDLPLMLKKLTELEPVPEGDGKTTLALSRRTCATYEYYATLNPRTSRKYGKTLAKTFDVRCFTSSEELDAELPNVVPSGGHAWLLTDMSMGELKELQKRHKKRLAFAHRGSAMPHKLEELTPIQR